MSTTRPTFRPHPEPSLSSLSIGQSVTIDATAGDDCAWEDMRRFHKKTGEIVGIEDVLPGLVRVRIGKGFALFRPAMIRI